MATGNSRDMKSSHLGRLGLRWGGGRIHWKWAQRILRGGKRVLKLDGGGGCATC